MRPPSYFLAINDFGGHLTFFHGPIRIPVTLLRLSVLLVITSSKIKAAFKVTRRQNECRGEFGQFALQQNNIRPSKVQADAMTGSRPDTFTRFGKQNIFATSMRRYGSQQIHSRSRKGNSNISTSLNEH